MIKNINIKQQSLQINSNMSYSPQQQVDSNNSSSFSSNSSSSASPTMSDNALDFEKIFSVCNQDLKLFGKLCESDSFIKTVDLYNKLIKQNSANSQELVFDALKYPGEYKSLNSIEQKSENESCLIKFSPTKAQDEFYMTLSRQNMPKLLMAYEDREEYLKNEHVLNKTFLVERQKQQIEPKSNESLNDLDKFLMQKNELSDGIESLYNYINENEKIAEENIENEQLISDEGRFLLNKAEYYSVDNLKLVNIEKVN